MTQLKISTQKLQTSLPFGEILEAADKLPVHDQEALRDILAKRIVDYRREEIFREIKEAQKEYKAGQGKTRKPDEIIDEI